MHIPRLIGAAAIGSGSAAYAYLFGRGLPNLPPEWQVPMCLLVAVLGTPLWYVALSPREYK